MFMQKNVRNRHHTATLCQSSCILAAKKELKLAALFRRTELLHRKLYLPAKAGELLTCIKLAQDLPCNPSLLSPQFPSRSYLSLSFLLHDYLLNKGESAPYTNNRGEAKNTATTKSSSRIGDASIFWYHCGSTSLVCILSSILSSFRIQGQDSREYVTQNVTARKFPDFFAYLQETNDRAQQTAEDQQVWRPPQKPGWQRESHAGLLQGG